MNNKFPVVTALKSVPGLADDRTTILTRWLVRDRQFVYKDDPIAVFESMDCELEYPADCDGVIIQTISEGEQVLSNTIFCVIKSYEKK